MQTFLPYPDFALSAEALDRVRLGKQRVETLQLLRALVIPDYGWQRHPATRMWMGHIPALVRYGLAMADEWVRRGGTDTTRTQILEFAPGADQAGRLPLPPWLGDPAFHLAHRSSLLRKDPEYYGPLFPGVPDDLPYLWPEPERELLPAEPAGERLWIARTGRLPAEPQPAGPASYVFLAAASPAGRAGGKWGRQVRAFQEEMHDGDPVAFPADAGLRFVLARVAGPVRQVDGGWQRQVEVTGMLVRREFDCPALLQDPRTLFRIPLPPALSR
jgi:hypothetical protein